MQTNWQAALVLAIVLSAGPAAGGGLGPEQNYMLRCTGCHGADGSGSVRGRIPDFRDSVASFSYIPEGRKYLMHVPGVVGSGLNDREIAAVLNYIMVAWGGESLQAEDYAPFTAEEVQALRQTDLKDVVKYRRTVVERLKDENRPVADYPWP